MKNISTTWKKSHNVSHNADEKDKVPILESNENHKPLSRKGTALIILHKISKFMDSQKKINL